MTGYAAFARVERGHVSAPRTVEAGVTRPVAEVEGAAGSSAASEPAGESRLRAALAAAREQWELTTFFLFDANSWR